MPLKTFSALTTFGYFDFRLIPLNQCAGWIRDILVRIRILASDERIRIRIRTKIFSDFRMQKINFTW
jgi:hypothetical protein